MNSKVKDKKDFQPFLLAFATGICFVLAFFPFGWGWIGWLAPVGVLTLVIKKKLTGRRSYIQIWLALFVCWLALFQCVRLPHWAGYIGWPILSGFLCSYVFLFVVVTRQFVHGWKIPVLIAAPIAWTGLEYIQAHFCTGISLGMLSHTQSEYPQLIQVADLGGCYTVSFLMVAIAAGVVFAASGTLALVGLVFSKWSLALVQVVVGIAQAVLLFLFMIGYGNYRLEEANRERVDHPIQIGLIQGAIDTRFPSEAEIREYLDSFTRQYTQLSQEACLELSESLDLVIWPESMFPVTDYYPGEGTLTVDQQRRISEFESAIFATAHIVTGAGRIERNGGGQRFVVTGTPVPILAGANSSPVGKERVFYNSAILISNEGKVISRYGKMKLVLFGEFVPLGDVFPWLYNFFPIPPGLKAWDKPVAMEVDGLVYSPSICFESTYPHLIRNQVLELERVGSKPDMLVNVTNDGWFYGSTALDMHFANNVLRAVENRMPMLIAANTGFSGQIDSAGRVVRKGPRRKADVLIVKAFSSNQSSIYHKIGDWPAFSCFIAVLVGFFALICAPFLSKKLQLNDHLDEGADPGLLS